MWSVSITTDVLCMLLSMFRKGVYKFLLIAVVAPIILSTVFFSMPGIEVFTNIASEYFGDKKSVFLTSSSLSDSVCYPVKVYGLAKVGEVELPVIFVRRDILSNDSMMYRKVSNTCDSDISVPREVYRDGMENVVTINGSKSCFSYTHNYMNAVIIFTDNDIESPTRLCITSMANLLRIGTLWLDSEMNRLYLFLALLNTLIHIPLIYIAVSKSYSMLKEEVSVFLSMGSSKRRVIISVTLSITLLTIISTLFLVMLSIVSLNILHKVINVFWFLPQPSLRMSVVLIPIAITTAAFFASIAVGLKVVNHV